MHRKSASSYKLNFAGQGFVSFHRPSLECLTFFVHKFAAVVEVVAVVCSRLAEEVLALVEMAAFAKAGPFRRCRIETKVESHFDVRSGCSAS